MKKKDNKKYFTLRYFSSGLLIKVFAFGITAIGGIVLLFQALLSIRDNKFLGDENVFFQHIDPFIQITGVIVAIIILLIIGGQHIYKKYK